MSGVSMTCKSGAGVSLSCSQVMRLHRQSFNCPNVVHPFCDVQRAYCSRNRKSSELILAQKIVAIDTFHAMIRIVP